MSRIYEALKTAQEFRAKSGLTSGDGLGVMEMPERRVSSREDLDIDLTVYGRAAGETPFYEHAKAVSGNANGGLFLLAVPVVEGQDLLLINNRASLEQVCRVVNFTIRDPQTSEVSVVFPFPNPEFWQVSSVPGEIK